jgi:hypothetical protein
MPMMGIETVPASGGRLTFFIISGPRISEQKSGIAKSTFDIDQ